MFNATTLDKLREDDELLPVVLTDTGDTLNLGAESAQERRPRSDRAHEAELGEATADEIMQWIEPDFFIIAYGQDDFCLRSEGLVQLLPVEITFETS